MRVRGKSLVALATLLGSTAVYAADRVKLHWSAPAECPDGPSVVAEVDRLLRSSTVGVDKPPIEVSAEVQKDSGGGFGVKLTVQREGEVRDRQLKGASCQALADATAVILALMIDPTAVHTDPEPVEEAEPVAPLPPESPSSSSPPPPPGPVSSTISRPAPPPWSWTQPPRPDERLVRWRVSAWTGVDVGSLPGISFGLGLAGGLVIGPQRVEVGFGYRLRRAATVVERPGTGGDVDLLAGWAATCRALVTEPIEVGPCIGLEVGRLHAKGFGVTNPGEGSDLWLAGMGGGLLMWALAPSVAVGLRVDVVVPLVRARFVLEDVGPVYRVSGVAGRMTGGIELRF